jgi:tetratricopeptide (TPR) repeat protein
LSAAIEVDFTVVRVASLMESDPAAAAREAARIVRAHPGHAAAALLLGTALRACGDTEAAAAELSALAEARPDSAVIRLELGRALRRSGRDSEARLALERAVELAPDLGEGWRELSLLYAACGECAACDAAYARFKSLVAEDAGLNEAAAAVATARFPAAEGLLKRVLERSPEHVEALRMLGRVAAAREDYPEAERLLEECLRLAPGYTGARLDLVELLNRQFRGAPMLSLLERLLASEPGNPWYRTLQAAAYNLMGQSERALPILRSMVREFPGDASIWLQYGNALRVMGDQVEAIGAYRRCIELKPGFGEAWSALGNLKTLRLTPADVAALRTQLAHEDLSHEDRVHLEFTLGKALEDARDFAGSFEHYARGNELRRAVVPHDRERLTRLVRDSRALYGAPFFDARAGWGCPSREPIFIVGLPRAGSTLIEQILASHSLVEGTRELTNVLSFATELGARRSDDPARPSAYPRSVAQLSRSQLAALGERYLEETRSQRRLGRPHFVDKLGSNFLHLGLIHLMLPNARIVDARRAALACCFANFKQHFPIGFSVTNSLEDLGHCYREYVSLMAHFDQVLPGRIYRVCYEDLVSDLEREVRGLLEYCGLPFEEQCLRFHETRRVVQTVSSEQVRQPLYGEAVDQWRHYEPWLAPLKEALGDLATAAADRGQH